MVTVLAAVLAQVICGEECDSLLQHVVDGDGPNLLGRDSLGKFKVGQFTIQAISDKHAAVSADEVGTLNGLKVKLQVDPNISPKFFKACPVLYSLKGQVDTELRQLEQDGIISPVQFSRWGPPIVPVKNTAGGLWSSLTTNPCHIS